jgi:signal transduction histidine kinase
MAASLTYSTTPFPRLFPRRGAWLLLFLTILSPARGEEKKDDGSLLQRFVGFFSRELKRIDAEIQSVQDELAMLPAPPANQQTYRLGFRTKPASRDVEKWVSVDLGSVQRVESIVLVPVEVAFTGWDGPGYGFPQRFRVELAEKADFSDASIVAKDEGTDVPNPLNFPVVIDTQGEFARYVRVVATKMWTEPRRGLAVGPRIFALGELMVLNGPLNLAAGLPAESLQASDRDSDETLPSWSLANLVDGQSILGPPVARAGSEETSPNPTSGFLSDPKANQKTEEWIQVDLGEVRDLQEVRLFPARPADQPYQRGFAFPLAYRVEASEDPEFASPVLLGMVNASSQSNPNPLDNPSSIQLRNPGGAPRKGRIVRVTATQLGRLPTDRSKFAFGLAEMQVFADYQNVAFGQKVAASSEVKGQPTWSAKFATDGFTSQGKIIDWPDWLARLEKRKDLSARLLSLRSLRETRSADLMESVISMAGYTVLGLVTLLIVLNIRSHVKKRRALEALRTRIARDVHDEIGSGLGTISLLSQLAQTGDDEEMRKDLGEIHRISVGMAESMRDIVWFNRTDVDTVRDLLLRLRETAETMLAGHDLRFETIGEEFVKPIPMERRREIFLVFKEAIHNIIKHAKATQVHISAGLEGALFRLIIRDNGRGFDPQKQSSGTGLGSIKHRAETLKGEISFQTQPGEGTVLSLAARL